MRWSHNEICSQNVDIYNLIRVVLHALIWTTCYDDFLFNYPRCRISPGCSCVSESDSINSTNTVSLRFIRVLRNDLDDHSPPEWSSSDPTYPRFSRRVQFLAQSSLHFLSLGLPPLLVIVATNQALAVGNLDRALRLPRSNRNIIISTVSRSWVLYARTQNYRRQARHFGSCLTCQSAGPWH